MRRLAAAALCAALAAACGGTTGETDERPSGGSSPAAEQLVATVASYDLAAGVPSRFLLGILTGDEQVLAGGEARMRFLYLGEQQAEGEPQPAGEGTGRFLPIPDEEEDHTHADGPPHGAGVYAIPEITFDRPGIYRVEAEVGLEGETLRGTAAFTVLPEPQVPIPGDRAPLVENLTVRSDAPPEAVDSRAADGHEIPDPILHQTSIADALRRRNPVVAVFSTPVYCVSRFCGPITDMVEGLATQYGEVAEFVHVEIWRDFQERVINEAAAEWLLHGGNLQEPWVFLIGRDGRILARWDNVATRQEIVPWLEQLA